MYDLNEIMEPCWRAGTIRKESVTFLEESGYRAVLWHRPEKILKVESSDGKTVYREGLDYELRDSALVLPETSAIPRIANRELYSAQAQEGKAFGCTDGGYLLFSEGSFWHKLQTYVTYTSGEAFPVELIPKKTALLPGTLEKLGRGDTLRMVVYGDSISEGYNASGFVGAEPYLPTYSQLVQEYAAARGKHIWLKNTALAGQDTNWALEHVEERVCAYDPDLVILAFGMNDGTAGMDGARFRENVETLRRIIRQHAPRCEFLLVAPILPNKKACMLDEGRTPFFGTQEQYAPQLLQLREAGTDVVNMTAIHRALLERKQYPDMTGNNVNHPNDYLVRWYAQCICSVLGLYDESGA